MTQSMIERAARALCKFDGRDPDELRDDGDFRLWEAYAPPARAVLQAIRKPDEAMIDHAYARLADAQELEDGWRYMIDAALAD